MGPLASHAYRAASERERGWHVVTKAFSAKKLGRGLQALISAPSRTTVSDTAVRIRSLHCGRSRLARIQAARLTRRRNANFDVSWIDEPDGVPDPRTPFTRWWTIEPELTRFQRPRRQLQVLGVHQLQPSGQALGRLASSSFGNLPVASASARWSRRQHSQSVHARVPRSRGVTQLGELRTRDRRSASRCSKNCATIVGESSESTGATEYKRGSAIDSN